jgi:hypothetical protein
LASSEQRAAAHVEDAVVELGDRDRARQRRQLESLTIEIDVGVGEPRAGLGAPRSPSMNS